MRYLCRIVDTIGPFIEPRQVLVERVAVLEGHKAAVFALAGGMDDKSVYSGAGDGLIAKWVPGKSPDGEAVAGINTNIFSLFNIGNGRELLAGDMFGGLHLIDTQQNRETGLISNAGHAIFDILPHDKDQYWIACGDGSLLLVNLDPFHVIENYLLGKSNLRRLVSVEDEIWVASSNGQIHILDQKNGKLKQSIEAHPSAIFSLAYIPETGKVISGGMDAQLRVWNASDKGSEGNIEAHLYTVNDLKLNPAHTLLASASRDKTIRIWDTRSLTLLKSVERFRDGGHAHSVNKLFWWPDGSHLISCSDDRTVIVWKITINS
jgi:WD repeat-containing protein 61